MSDEIPKPAVITPDERTTLGAIGATIDEIRGRGPDLAFRVVLVLLLLRLVWPMALPLLLGGFVTIVLFPLTQKVAARLGRGRDAAPAIVTFGTVTAVLVPCIWLAVRLSYGARRFITSLLATGSDSSRDKLIGLIHDVSRGLISIEDAERWLGEGSRKLAAVIGAVLADAATSLPEGITNLFLFVLTVYFGLRDGRRLHVWARRVSPVSRARTSQLFVAIQRAAQGTLVGMVAVAFVQGGLAMLAFLVLGVDHAILLGVIAAVCSTIPIVGTTPVTFGAAILLYVHGRPVAAVAMLAVAMVIGVSDNVVRPWVQSQHDDMHPLLALLSIFGGLAVFGPSGLLLGPVIASMAVWAVESGPERREPEETEADG